MGTAEGEPGSLPAHQQGPRDRRPPGLQKAGLAAWVELWGARFQLSVRRDRERQRDLGSEALLPGAPSFSGGWCGRASLPGPGHLRIQEDAGGY